MSDVKQITISPDGLSSFSVTHEAGVEVSHNTIGIENQPDRVDGAGNPIKEEKVVVTGVTLPNCVNNRTLRTYEKVREWVRNGALATVTVRHRNGDIYQYLNASATGAIELNVTKTTFSLTIQGDYNSGLQS